MLDKTRAEAIARGEKYYFTGIPCKHGHLAKRTTSARHCTECLKARSAKNKGKTPPREPAQVDLGLSVLCNLAEYGDTLTVPDIADVCGCSTQYIYNIEQQAINKLTMMDDNPLRDFYEYS